MNSPISSISLHVAVVEDDEVMSQTIADWLQHAGYAVEVFDDGRKLLKTDVSRFHVILLDWMLPGLLGDQILVKLRQVSNYTGAVIFVTSMETEKDITFAMGLGADDYMVKPPSRAILLSRVNAVCRRMGVVAVMRKMPENSAFTFDESNRVMKLHGVEMPLTRREFDLAVFLFRRLGQLVSRDELLQGVWGKPNGLETRTVDVHISHLRRRLKLRPENGFKLSTVHSLGYRLEHVVPDNTRI